MMEEDTEYLKLPLEDRCVHKLWKARLSGYEECTKYFATITDEKSPEFNKFYPLMKKFVADSNAVAQEKALDAVLAFAENAAVATKTTGDVISGLVSKCLGAPKKGTQDKAIEIVLMYCEIEKYEVVQEELIKGFNQKNPKVVAGCIRALSTALREFGIKVISIKVLIKQIGPLLEHRDKVVREEGKKMVIEMYRWIGKALRPQLSALKPVQIEELESEFDKLENTKAVQNRFLRSEQELKAKMDSQVDEEDGEEGVEEEGHCEQVDPFDFVDFVDVLSQIPKDFYEKLDAKKWQERKEALEQLLPLVQNSKIEQGDFHELLKCLRKIIAKDTNVMIVALAAQCITGLAKGLRKKFAPYALSCMETIFEKFKEKKTNVVAALRESSDAVFISISVEQIQECACSALNNKNPQVKAETAAFLARSFCHCTPAVLSKKLLKAFVSDLIKTLNESDPTVRGNSAEAIGTLLKLVGEKALGPFLSDIDNLKMEKIREACEKVELKVKASQKPKGARKVSPSEQQKVSDKSVKTALLRRSRPASSTITRTRKAPSCGKERQSIGEVLEQELTTEEALEKVMEVLPGEALSGLSDVNWKARLTALETFNNAVQQMNKNEIPTQAFLLALNQKPGFRDSNFQVLKLKLEAIKFLAENTSFTRRSAEVCMADIIEKLGDVKNGHLVLDVLTSMAEAISLQWVGLEVLTKAFEQKSPKVQEVALKWTTQALMDFGLCIPPKMMLGEIKKALVHTNPAVKSAGIQLCGVVYLFVGPSFRTHFDAEKPALVQQLDAEFDKMRDRTPPVPTRGLNQNDMEDTSPDDTCDSVPSSKKVAQNKGIGRSPLAKSGTGKTGAGTAANSSAIKGPAGVKKPVRASSASRGNAAAKKEPEDEAGPLMQVNNLKQHRIADEQRLKILRWDFTTPRPEFISQLRDQMMNAGFSKQLVSNMFHQDFKFHIRAIDSLMKDLPANLDACISNLDLVLRWMTLRFFDTNPSVIMKGMDYLQQVFQTLSDDGYHMPDHEAYSFLPFLVVKFGDPKEAIRSPARAIAKSICRVYPASKVSPYIIEGLKTKNARQRAECLEALGALIELNGTYVCQPTPAAALKEVARQIADRDNAVRNAALNCIVQVYFREGDKVYKLIGNLSDKEMSLLEERIKRSVKNKPVVKKPEVTELSTVKGIGGGTSIAGRANRIVPTLGQTPPVIHRGDKEGSTDRRLDHSRGENRTGNPAFQFDFGLIEKLVEDTDLSEPQQKLHIEEIPDLHEIMNYKPVCPTSSLSSRIGRLSAGKASKMSAVDDVEDAAQAINLVISQVATSDTNTIITALSQIDEVVQSEERCTELAPHIDHLLHVATLQYRMVLNTKMADANTSKEDCIRLYRSLTNCLMMIFTNKELGCKATRGALHDVIHVLISILLDPRLSPLEDSAPVIRIINVLVVKIIEKAEITNVFSAVIRLLHETVASGGGTSKFTELVMKCSWKIMRILPSRTESLDLHQILLDVHNFLQAYPSSSWMEQSSDLPLRTIKTVLHTLCKHFGSTVLVHINKIDNAQGSELHRYLTKTLKKSKQEDQGAREDSNKLCPAHEESPSDAKVQKKLTKASHNTLSEIFRKIGSKENTKEGLVQLYDFKQQHPEADIDPFLRKSSQFFQNYIERGLKRVEMERQAEGKLAASPADGNPKSGPPLSSYQMEKIKITELVDQFKSLAVQAGFDNNYIESAVKTICSSEQKPAEDVSDGLKCIQYDMEVKKE